MGDMAEYVWPAQLLITANTWGINGVSIAEISYRHILTKSRPSVCTLATTFGMTSFLEPRRQHMRLLAACRSLKSLLLPHLSNRPGS